MKNMRRLAAVALISVFAISVAGCNMISKTEAGIKKSPVAKFDNETITKGQLDERMAGLQQSFIQQYGNDYLKNSDAKTQYVTQEKSMLDNMITEKILLKKADELKVMPTDEKEKTDLINKKMDELKKAYTEDQIKQAGFSGGYNDAKFKDYVKDLTVMDKVYENITKDIKVDDAKAQDYYTKNQSQYTEKPNMIKLAHILVATKEEADKVEQRLKNGEDFGKLAKELSTDTGSKDNNGEYEVPFVGSGFDETFMSTALAQAEGKISAPVQTQYGFHIIKTISKTNYPVKKFEDVKEDIKKTLLDQEKQTKYTDTMTKWRTDAKIKTYEENL
ncbi:peptidylprolyl isomerase [Clostridium sp. YIM B02515]|uniref:peptidylprolyl isomerase n=2 Tax=Clostridium rhizosphaerae TaxID=2803861 RepID=A0ABS1TC80_9CLOT|nr:peptidylprolyl isomerase [Clostridium rhizosphaerae]